MKNEGRGSLVQIYLLLIEKRSLFYAEGAERLDGQEQPAPREGWRGWAERKYQSLQTTLKESEGGVGLRMRRAWEWLQRRTSPDETLLRSMRSATSLKIYYPSELTEALARKEWEEYLSSRRRQHLFWLIINAIVSPLSLLLAPVPGPNVIGYWFVYRAVCHWLALLGVRRAKSFEAQIEFAPTTALDGALNSVDANQLALIEASLNLKGLADFVKRVTTKETSQRPSALNVA